MSIGERISSLRRKNQLSQGDLASLLGVSRQAVSKWENDSSSPDTLRLIKLADVLNTDVEFLATGKHTDVEPPPIIVKVVNRDPVIQEKIVEKIVEKPVLQKVIRVRYRNQPVTLAVVACGFFILGLLIGIMI